MKKLLRKINYRFILWFYLVSSIYSILWYYFLDPSTDGYLSSNNLPSRFLNFYDHNLIAVINFFEDLRFFRFDLYDDSMLSWNTVFPLLIVVASAIFYLSKYRDSRLLRYLLSISILIMSIGFLSGIYYAILRFDSYTMSRFALFLLFKLKTIALFFIHYHVIQHLNKHDEVDEILDLKTIDPSLLASKGRRFANYIIDCFPRIIVSFLLITFLINLSRQGMISGDLGGRFGEYLFRFGIVFFSVLLVYFLTESLFLRSPAKFLTNTRVFTITDKNKTATIALRSLIRLIPILDSCSFLFGKKTEGFHDAWSQTIVVKNKNSGIAHGWYFIIFPLVILLSFAPKMIVNAVNEYQFKKVYQQYEENKTKNRKRQYLSLKKGDVREGSVYLYHVDSIDNENFYLSFVRKESAKEPFNINDYSTTEYDDLSKKLYKKIVPKREVLNGKESVQFLLGPNKPLINDVLLRISAWSSNGITESIQKYNLQFKTNNCNTCYILKFKDLNDNLTLKNGRVYNGIINLEIDNEKEPLENKTYAITATIANRETGKTITYQVEFTKYGVTNFYQIEP